MFAVVPAAIALEQSSACSGSEPWHLWQQNRLSIQATWDAGHIDSQCLLRMLLCLRLRLLPRLQPHPVLRLSLRSSCACSCAFGTGPGTYAGDGTGTGTGPGTSTGPGTGPGMAWHVVNKPLPCLTSLQHMPSMGQINGCASGARHAYLWRGLYSRPSRWRRIPLWQG